MLSFGKYKKKKTQALTLTPILTLMLVELPKTTPLKTFPSNHPW